MAKAKKPTTKEQFVPGTKIKILPGLVALLEPIEKAVPDPANPRRTKNLDVLMASLSRFGVRKPIVVNSRDNQIEAGHQTREALLKLGATAVPVIWANDDRIDAAAFNIADNRSAEIVAEWDEVALAKLIKELYAEDAIDAIGYNENQIEGLLDSFGELETVDLEDPDDDDFIGTEFDDAAGDSTHSNRVIIVYENDHEKEQLENLLGAKLVRVVWSYAEICAAREEAAGGSK